jgi:acetyltransferase-like isoleucine patch superfamily enzyme
MRKLCEAKFKYFAKSAEFRPGAYAIGCSKISVGARVVVRPATMLFADPRRGLGGTITIEDDVLLGSAVHIYVNNHAFNDLSIPIIDQGHKPPSSVLIEQGAWIGAGAVILPGVGIGRNSVIGAGSVVTKSIPPMSVAAGNPAKVIRSRMANQFTHDNQKEDDRDH